MYVNGWEMVIIGDILIYGQANLLLGRLLPDYFPKIFGKTADLPLDHGIVIQKFAELTAQINSESDKHLTPEEVASGYVLGPVSPERALLTALDS